MNYFISDTHLGHEAVIKLCNRPFEDISEMDQIIINNWNKRVTPKDNVYIIGDFCYKSKESPLYYLEKLNGNKHLICGNHDRHLLKDTEALSKFIRVEKLSVINEGKSMIVLCHYPIAEWNGYYRGWYHIHGHLHNRRNKTFEYLRAEDKALNAGVDINGFVPVTLEELIENNNYFKNKIVL